MSGIKKNSQNRGYVLVILTTVYAFNFIDRQILVILSEPIKADLGLTDTQLGLLTGLAFAALYVTMGLPIARLADKGNRKNIVVASLTVWSLMTAISGFVANFFQLLLARIGVGIGEAGGSPPSHSIISDYFPPEKRGTALAIYSTGIYIGVLLGFVIGGVIAKLYGWRVTFYAIGIPGILLAIVLYFTVKEPKKGQSDAISISDHMPKLTDVFKTLFFNKTFVFAALGAGFMAFGSYGTGNFMPSFLLRVHRMDIALAGYTLGLIFGVGGGVGTFLGGYFADRFGVKDLRWHLWVPMITGFVGYIPFAVAIFTSDIYWALTMLFLAVFLMAFNLAPVIAVTHSLVNARMRAFASSVLFLILNLIGLGLGPLVVGYLSDLLTPTYGDLSLRWAFCITFLSGATATMFFGLAAINYRRDLKKVQA